MKTDLQKAALQKLARLTQHDHLPSGTTRQFPGSSVEKMFGSEEAYKWRKRCEWFKRFQPDIGMSCPWKSEL